jgi:hypothetical protein
MTDQKKGIAGGVGLAGIVALLALWPQVQPILAWAWANLGVVLGREQVQAVLAAMTIAVTAGVALPKWLPGDWTPARTRTVTGLACSLMALSAAVVLVPTRVGAVYAVLAAFASPTASAALRQLWYWAKPEAKPESLKS